jgi:DNA polymerase I
VDSLETLKEMIQHIQKHDIIAYDTETNSLNPRKGKIIGFSVSAEIGVGYYMPTMVFSDDELKDIYIEDNLCHDLAKRVLSLLLTKKVIGHNLSFDIRFTKNFYGVDY